MFEYLMSKLFFRVFWPNQCSGSNWIELGFKACQGVMPGYYARIDNLLDLSENTTEVRKKLLLKSRDYGPRLEQQVY